MSVTAAQGVESPDAALDLVGVSKTYGATHALRAVTLTIAPGEIRGLVGANGAGKSTLMRLAAGVESPDEGWVAWGGHRVARASPARATRAGVGYVPQELTLYPNLTVAENVTLGYRGESRKVRLTRLDDLVRQVTESLGDLPIDLPWREPVATLPVEQQVLCQVARAVYRHPRILILDEPTSGLTVDEAQRLFSLIRILRARGMAAVFISHHLNEVVELCDSVTILRDGATIGTHAPPPDREFLIAEMVGKTTALRHARRAQALNASPANAALELEDAETHGLAAVSLSIAHGEIYGIAGLAGSGRSRLARLIAGSLPLTGGTMRFEGRELRLGSPRMALRQGIVMLPEDRKLHGLLLGQNGIRNVTLPMLNKTSRGRIFTHSGRERAYAIAACDELVAPDQLHRPVMQLSGGNQQKVLFGRARACKPTLLVLDEPARGIDVRARGELFRVIREIAEAGTTVILVSSEFEDLLAVSDRIGVMHHRRLLAHVVASDSTEADLLSLSYGGRHPDG